MLAVKNVTYKIEKKTLLNDVSVLFETGKLHLIIGPNGAGKSTLINVISGQIKPQTGSVEYNGQNIRYQSVSYLAKTRSVLSQNIDLAFPLQVWEVVMMGRYPHFTGKPTEKDETACEEAMHYFDVWDMRDRNYLTLSGGEKQRVHFARILSQIWYPVPGQDRYLLLDEPLTFLDVKYQFDFMRKVTAFLRNNNVTVIGVVHDLNLAAKFADNLVLIKNGKILAIGNRETVLSKENVFQAYNLAPVIHFEGEDMYLFFR